jgi:hypothetical protein
MRLTTLAKVGVGITALALVAGAATLPAAADPTNPSAFGKLVGVGSDTTQDVMNGIANALGGPTNNPIIASYNATVNAPIQPRSNGPLIDRPNGSGDGAAALLTSIGQSASGAWKTYVATGTPTQLDAANDTTTGQVDFSRSSSGPGANAIAGGVLTYIPFATDALDYATDSSSKFSAFTNGLTVAQIKSIYNGSVNEIITGTEQGDPQLVDSTSYTPASDETVTPIHVYVPQAGSGTRKFWLGTFLGITDNATNVDHLSGSSPISDVEVSGTFGDGEAPVLSNSSDPSSTTPVEEHDGTVLEGDDGAIMPFSIGKWVADNNGLATDNTHGAILGTINNSGTGVSATTETNSVYALNSSYASDFASSNLTRLVYNVIPTREISDPSSVTRWAFVGPNSLVCQEGSVISQYGFQTLGLTSAAGTSECGDTSRTAYAASTATVTVTPSVATLGYGSTYNATATVASVGNGGGTVDFKIGDRVVDTEVVPSGATTDANEQVTATGLSATGFAPGTWSLTAVFHPTLEGVQSNATSPASTFTVTKLASTVTVVDPTLSHKVAPVIEVTVTAPSGIVPTGVVSIKTSSKTLASKVTLIDGMATITLPKYSAKGEHTLYVEYYGDANVNPTTSFKFHYTAS